MLDHLIARGYEPGGGMLCSTSSVFYLNIPKNASTYLTNILYNNGWNYHSADCSQFNQCIVVLRDPIDRWVSGFATYASSWLLSAGYGSDHFVEDYTPLVERLIFDNLVFDDHTTPQAEFVSQLPAIDITYFKLNKNIIQQIGKHLNISLTVSDVDTNASDSNYDQKQITTFIQHQIDNDPVLKSRIIERYKNDFNLISSVQFYNDPR